jgi:hypothetical protein
MTPKEKAKELVNKFKEQDTKGILFTADFNPKREQRILDKAKSCALIAVDLLLYYSESPEAFIEFEEVKQEIENL